MNDELWDKPDAEDRDSPPLLDGPFDDHFFRDKAVVNELTDAEYSPATDTSGDLNQGNGGCVFTTCGYQLEMLEESLRGNIIVAMDTGSGKTHIAVLRIQRELETITESQIIWFIAPTVSLCAQQYETFQTQINSIEMKLLSGADGVDLWTARQWDVVLMDVKLVVSTPQILLDALTHGYVQMSSLALLVLDEAHNCTKKSPGAKIMKDFYRHNQSNNHGIPSILGLTASPIVRSRIDSLNDIENTLDSICRTPNKHRAELRQEVKVPQFIQVMYNGSNTEQNTETLRNLRNALYDMSTIYFNEDPRIIALQDESSNRSRRRLEELRLTRKTPCFEQLAGFLRMTQSIFDRLGAWASDFYASEVLKNLRQMVQNDCYNLWEISNAEKRYLAKTLQNVEVPLSTPEPLESSNISDQVLRLISLLLMQKPENFSGIIFVQERATAEVLARFLSKYPLTRDVFRVGAMVGSSAMTCRTRSLYELTDVGAQKRVLSQFRSGILNLLVATSVLEEGIDVPSCNLVISFQKPATIKSFVQRRGRARQKDSKLVLMIPEDDNDPRKNEFQELEAQIKKLYEDEQRQLQPLLELEDNENHDGRHVRLPTGALLDLDNAVQHLYHFCARLPAGPYVDLRPDFICTKRGDDGKVQANVILPLSVNETVRFARSRASWRSEKNAIKDAAYEAYIALHLAGLVDNHFLPQPYLDNEAEALVSSAIEKRPSLVAVSEQLNPWVSVAQAWNSTKKPEIHGAFIRLFYQDHCFLEVKTVFPFPAPNISPISMYFDTKTAITVIISNSIEEKHEREYDHEIREHSFLEAAGYSWRHTGKSLVMRFSARRESSSQDGKAELMFLNAGLIRYEENPQLSYIYYTTLQEKPHHSLVQNPYIGYEEAACTPHFVAARKSKRRDFLRKPGPEEGLVSKRPYAFVFPENKCTFDELPFKHVLFGTLIPSIMHRFGVHFLAKQLCSSIFKDVEVSNIVLVIEAICASSAREERNYQRLEFYGDCLLKLFTSIQLIDEYPLWHEAYLTMKKSGVVSNARLAKEAIRLGLDKFVITKPFTGRKWEPQFVEDLVEVSSDGRREMSTKILADVVESLIGAIALGSGDFGLSDQLLSVMTVFLPDVTWLPLKTRSDSLFRRAPDSMKLPVTLKPVEELIGYEFRKKSLLVEAMTHCSYGSGSGSLERIEFLGDAILDFIVVKNVFHHGLSHIEMHLMRTALVNADFLAFVCMDSSAPLWRYMRHTAPRLGFDQMATNKRYVEFRDQIRNEIQFGSHYPWTLLSGLRAQKFHSDLIESLIGAVWIDSGSFDTCQAILEKLNILPYLRRIRKQGVKLLHPKEALGMLADTELVTYKVETRNILQEVGVEEFLCSVSVAHVEIHRAEGGVGREHIMTKAADESIKIIEELKRTGSWAKILSGSDASKIEDAGIKPGYERDDDDVTMAMH